MIVGTRRGTARDDATLWINNGTVVVGGVEYPVLEVTLNNKAGDKADFLSFTWECVAVAEDTVDI